VLTILSRLSLADFAQSSGAMFGRKSASSGVKPRMPPLSKQQLTTALAKGEYERYYADCIPALKERLPDLNDEECVRLLAEWWPNVDQCAAKYQAAQDWHASTFPIPRNLVVPTLRTGKFIVHGFDRVGRPVAYFRTSLHDPSKFAPEVTVRAILFTLDACMKRASQDPRFNMDEVTTVVDRTNASMKNTDVEFIKLFYQVRRRRVARGLVQYDSCCPESIINSSTSRSTSSILLMTRPSFRYPWQGRAPQPESHHPTADSSVLFALGLCCFRISHIASYLPLEGLKREECHLSECLVPPGVQGLLPGAGGGVHHLPRQRHVPGDLGAGEALPGREEPELDLHAGQEGGPERVHRAGGARRLYGRRQPRRARVVRGG
jgi:hypothetical protein